MMRLSFGLSPPCPLYLVCSLFCFQSYIPYIYLCIYPTYSRSTSVSFFISSGQLGQAELKWKAKLFVIGELPRKTKHRLLRKETFHCIKVIKIPWSYVVSQRGPSWMKVREEWAHRWKKRKLNWWHYVKFLSFN